MSASSPSTTAENRAESPTRQLAEFVSGLRFDALPAEVVEKAKTCVLDSIGCCLFGSTLSWTRMVAEMALEQGGQPQAHILGTTHRTSTTQAALVNGTAGHAFELDDAHTRASMHVGSVTVPVALALSEWMSSLSGREFITALVAGYEAGLRIGIAADGHIFKRGFHPAAVCGAFASAATASRALGLNADQTQNAFGVAGSQASGLMAAQEGAMVKRLHIGRAAQSGLYSALLARRGFTGILDVLEAPFGGFYNAVSEKWTRAYATAELGRTWEILAVGFKPYATAGACHASLAALDEIMLEGNLTAEDIVAINVRCTTYCHQHVAWPYVPRGVAAAQLNLFFGLAAMATDRAVLIAQFTEARLGDPQLIAFMSRIRIEADATLDALGHSNRYAMHMTVRAADGRTFQRQSRDRPGSPERPLSRPQLVDKFRLLAAPVLPAASIERIIATVSELDRLESAGALPGLLVPKIDQEKKN